MLTGLHVREFRRTDLPSLYGLVQNTIDVAYREVYPPEAVAFFKGHHTGDKILDDAAHGYIVVAERYGAILGTGTLRDTNVRRVFVSPQYQIRGLGKMIFGELEREARRRKAASLDLEASLVSRRFWQSLGFTVNREDFIPVGNGQKLNFYRMFKVLNDSR